jgi:ABC-type multidrug transport system ATPase subunit
METVVGTVIETAGLTKRYGDHLAVDRLDLTVQRGEVMGFLGPNGAGKSTTLRMLLGLVRPTAGSASLFGEPPGAPGALARVGALVETPALYPYLSGRDNLRAFAAYARCGQRRGQCPGSGGTQRTRARQGVRLLHGHAAAARSGSRPAQGS